MGCKCDPMYTEVDCSRKMCPKGNDVLDTRMNTEDSLVYQVQAITFKNVTQGVNSSFALTFKSTLNETYTTTPIVLSGDTGKTSMAKEMEKALLALPNGVVDGVSVNATYLASDTMGFYVFFSGTSVQGPQNMLVVETAQCGDGCTPRQVRLRLGPLRLLRGLHRLQVPGADGAHLSAAHSGSGTRPSLEGGAQHGSAQCLRSAA